MHIMISLDTYKEVREYVSRKRNISPVDYCESSKKERRQLSPKGGRKKIAEVERKLRIKSEYITHLKKAIHVLNLEHDKKKHHGLGC